MALILIGRFESFKDILGVEEPMDHMAANRWWECA